MSVGLFVNQLRAWFFGAIGTFAPAGVGSLNSPDFYAPTHIIIYSRPNRTVSALWYIGASTAQIYYNGSAKDMDLTFVKSWLTNYDGRETAYQWIQDYVDAMEASLLYINETVLDYVTSIRTDTPLMSGYNGTYNLETGALTLDAWSDFYASPNNDYQKKVGLASLIVHEFQHAYDFGEGIILSGERELAEQSATTKSMAYLKDEYNNLIHNADYESNKLYLQYIYAHELNYYRDNGGSDTQWDRIAQ